MKKLKGSFTVEAAMLFTFLMIVEITFVFAVIYVYDRALMVQDTNALVSNLRMGKDSYTDNPGDHPYLAMNNMVVRYEKKGVKQVVSIAGEWEVPVWPSLNSNISVNREIIAVRPETVLFLTEDIME